MSNLGMPFRVATVKDRVQTLASFSLRLGQMEEGIEAALCLVRCYQHRVQLKRDTITYYGCRLCRQSVEWLEAREVAAVLDSWMTLPWKQRDGRRYIDGLTFERLLERFESSPTSRG